MKPATVEKESVTKQAIVEALQNHVVDDLTGASEPGFGRFTKIDPPHTLFVLGKLYPEYSVDILTQNTSEDYANRFKPASQGFSFKVNQLPVEIEVDLSFKVWATLHPTLEEQREKADEPVEDGQEESSAGYKRKLNLAKPLTKVPVKARFTIGVSEAGYRRHGSAEIKHELNLALDHDDPGLIWYRPALKGSSKPTVGDIRDRKTWTNWEAANCGSPTVPEWRARIDTEVYQIEGSVHEIYVTVVNETVDPGEQELHGAKSKYFPLGTVDPNLYEVELACKPDSSRLIPYDLEQIPDSYRYDRSCPVLGMNSAAKEEDGWLKTDFAARARMNRTYPRDKSLKGKPLDVSFATLSDSPVPALEALVSALEEWTGENWSDTALDGLAANKGWDEESRRQAGRDAQAAAEEVNWVKAGLHLLGKDEELLSAFKLMNETIEFAAARKGYDSWRPFQIAFILGCLPNLVYKQADSKVNVLWFNTGGGKTEAYLGLNALAMFYERLKGRTGGAQTWARFPLRLLSLQQTQRMADSVIAAEVIRQRHSEIPRLRDCEPFGVGYYVGGQNTPNKIELPGTKFFASNGSWDPYKPEVVESCRVLESCPACDHSEKPKIEFNDTTHTLEHRCVNTNCVFHERLPVFVIDNDIYRHAPTVLVGTVDKLVLISQNKMFRILMGGPLSRCPVHGYSVSADECSIWGCQSSVTSVNENFGGIELEIQDELHLLRESLGALDSNYETLFHHVASEVSVPAIQIIGATATIEGYEEQADQLYRRAARRFPLPGPTKGESFWSYEVEGDPLRMYVAMLPRGTTMINTGYFITLSQRTFFENALADIPDFCRKTPGIPSGQDATIESYIRDSYEVLVAYCLKKNDVERYAKDVKVNPIICGSERNYDDITGDREFESIRHILMRLEKPPEDPGDRIRILGATSAISHGVDVNRLNMMITMGMPQQTAEYIQASARVGRRHPAVVFSLINPMRRKDVSHFRYFVKYAEYLDRLVEPVPVNRESLQLLKRVLPGGIMALLLQVYEPKWVFPNGKRSKNARDKFHFLNNVIAAIVAGDNGLSEGLYNDELAKHLKLAFRVQDSNPQFKEHAAYIDSYVHDLFNEFRLDGGTDKNATTSGSMDPAPPTTLRDVEESIPIRGDH